jgi:hypothetical protein
MSRKGFATRAETSRERGAGDERSEFERDKVEGLFETDVDPVLPNLSTAHHDVRMKRTQTHQKDEFSNF